VLERGGGTELDVDVVIFTDEDDEAVVGTVVVVVLFD